MDILKLWEPQRKIGNLFLCSFSPALFFHITLFLKSKLQSWRVETSPLTTSKPSRCSWTHAWLVELACRPSQFPALSLCLCLFSEGQWIRTRSPLPGTCTHTLSRSFFWSPTQLSASPACQIHHGLWYFFIWGIVRGKSWFWRCEWQAALPYGNSNRSISYSWTDWNSGTVRWFLQEIEEDTEACSNLKQLSRCNIVSYLRPAQVFVSGFQGYFYYKTNRLDCRNRLSRMCFSPVPASSFVLGAISRLSWFHLE